MLIQTRYFDINLIAWSRVRSRFVGKYNEKKRSMALFTAHLCITAGNVLSYCVDESNMLKVLKTVTLPPQNTKVIESSNLSLNQL